jgi:hypothetical protein
MRVYAVLDVPCPLSLSRLSGHPTKTSSVWRRQQQSKVPMLQHPPTLRRPLHSRASSLRCRSASCSDSPPNLDFATFCSRPITRPRSRPFYRHAQLGAAHVRLLACNLPPRMHSPAGSALGDELHKVRPRRVRSVPCPAQPSTTTTHNDSYTATTTRTHTEHEHPLDDSNILCEPIFY